MLNGNVDPVFRLEGSKVDMELDEDIFPEELGVVMEKVDDELEKEKTDVVSDWFGGKTKGAEKLELVVPRKVVVDSDESVGEDEEETLDTELVCCKKNKLEVTL